MWAAAALVAAEYVAFSVAFDSAHLRHRGDLWALAGYLGSIAVFIMTAAMGAVVWSDGSTGLSVLTGGRSFDRFTVMALVSHTAGALLLWTLTSRILSPTGPPPGAPAIWLVVWSLTLVAVPILALTAALPQDRPPLSNTVPALLAGCMIGCGAWLASLGSATFWWPLGPWTLRAVAWTLSQLPGAVVYTPGESLVGSAQFQVIISPACSGLEGVGLITVFAAAYLLIGRRELRFPQALLLLPLAVVASLLSNIGRIVALIVLGTSVSPAIAAGAFHARAGWLFFCTISLALVLATRQLAFFTTTPDVDVDKTHPTAAYLLPFVTWIAVTLGTELVKADVDWLYGARVLAAAAVLARYRSGYPSLRGRWSWESIAAGCVAAVLFVWLSPPQHDEDRQVWQHAWDQAPALARISWTGFRVCGSVIIVPLVEELAFRGYLLRRLLAQEFEHVEFDRWSWLSIVVSSVAFGAFHAGWLGGAVSGLLFGLVQVRGPGLVHAVRAHAISNALIAGYVLVHGHWWLWM
jgi:exosortase E/protease (VPEID-CTERM system)